MKILGTWIRISIPRKFLKLEDVKQLYSKENVCPSLTWFFCLFVCLFLSLILPPLSLPSIPPLPSFFFYITLISFLSLPHPFSPFFVSIFVASFSLYLSFSHSLTIAFSFSFVCHPWLYFLFSNILIKKKSFYLLFALLLLRGNLFLKFNIL